MKPSHSGGPLEPGLPVARCSWVTSPCLTEKQHPISHHFIKYIYLPAYVCVNDFQVFTQLRSFIIPYSFNHKSCFAILVLFQQFIRQNTQLILDFSTMTFGI